jgi:hypothetical protein
MDPREGDIAEDDKGNFLVYRGGNWYPSSEQGLPLERIPRADYGERYYQQPNGDIVREGPRGGFEVIERAGEASGAPATFGADARARVAINLDPLIEAQRVFDQMDAAGYNPSGARNVFAAGLEAIPFDAGFAARVAGGSDYNAYQQAAKTFEAALLPIMSGAAVTPTEAQRLIRAAIPQPGDSAEVLQQKARQRRQMVNAAAQGIGREAPFADVGASSAREIDQSTGLPTYGDVTRTNGTEIPLPNAGPPGPGSGPEYAVDVSDPSIPRDELVRILSSGGWVREGQGKPYKVGEGAVRFGQPGESGREIRPGVLEGAPQTPEQAVAARREDQGIGRRVDTAVRGVADALTFGLSDEITAGLNTVAPLDRGTRGGWGGDWNEAYRQNLDLMRSIDELDAEQMPLTRGAGQVAGAIAGGVGAARMAPQILRNAPRVAGSTMRQTASRIARNTARQGAIGAAGAGAYGYGSAEGDVVERLPETGYGVALGGVLGPVASKVGESVLAPAVGAIGRAVGLAPRRSVLETAVARAPDRINPNVLSQRADELEALGIEPALIDTLDDADLGMMRTLNTRPTQARERGSRLSQDRRRNLPTRLGTMAAEEISPETRPMLDIIKSNKAELSADAQAGMEQFGQNLVRLPENVVTILREPLARNALNQAAEVAAISMDPAERQAAARLRQLAAGEVTEITVRDAQNISKALRTSASSAFASDNPMAGPAYRTLADAIRGAARDQDDGYRAWLQNYADESDLLEAATTGRQFVTPSKDPVAERSTEAFIQEAQGATPPVQAMQRAAARGAVQAQGSNPTGARGILESFSSDQDMARRAQALGLDPARLRDRSQAELRMVENAQRVSPRVGSETSTNLADQAQAAADVMGGASELLTGRIPSFTTRLYRWATSIGFNDRQAEALALAAMDPAQTREVIRLLSERGMPKQKARDVVRAVRYYASQRSGEMAAGEE